MKKLNKIGMVVAMRKEVAPMLERIANIQKEEKIGQKQEYSDHRDRHRRNLFCQNHRHTTGQKPHQEKEEIEQTS